jgi:ATP-dependent DNA helicase RecG
MIIEIADEQMDTILNIEEGHFHDLKRKEIAPAKLSRSVSALGNSAGGELYVGIEEHDGDSKKTRQWNGFADAEDANAFLQMLHGIAPLADFIETTFLSHPKCKGHVLKIEIRKNSTILTSTDGGVYIRKGAQNLPVPEGAAMERLRLDKGVASYEDYVVDVDLAEVENSVVILDFLMGIIPTAEPEPWLKKQGLIRDRKPTVAGVMLFMDEPQAALPKRSAIKIFRYTTSDELPTRDQLAFNPLTIEGPAYNLIYSAVAQTQQIIEDMKKLGSEKLVEITYPPETLHEIITNAVLHRDYSVAADVQIKIFDNRVEVESPGRLAGHVSLENILDTQFARNQRLVRMVNKFPNPPNKDVGEGLNTAFDAMRKLRLRDPYIVETENSVRVFIPHQKLASPEDLVMEFLEENPEIVNRQARKICGISSENTMKGVFKRLEARGLIEQVPDRSKFKAAWQKKELTS